MASDATHSWLYHGAMIVFAPLRIVVHSLPVDAATAGRTYPAHYSTFTTPPPLLDPSRPLRHPLDAFRHLGPLHS
eukprot:scaffold2879_cov269-Prasinococcus_capsulatus_cf.AAC.38